MTSAKKNKRQKAHVVLLQQSGGRSFQPRLPHSPIPAEPGACRLRDTKANLTDRGVPLLTPGHSGEEYAGGTGLYPGAFLLAGSKPSPPATMQGGGVPPLASSTTQPPAASLGDPSLATARDKGAAPRSLGHPPSFPSPSRPPLASPASRMRNHPGAAGKHSRAASPRAPFSPRRPRNCACAGPPPPLGYYRPLHRGARYPGQRCHNGDWLREPRGGTRGPR